MSSDRTTGRSATTETDTDLLPDDIHLPQEEQIAEGDSDAQITEKLRHQGARIGRGGIAPAVFFPALAVVLGVAVLAVIIPTVVDDSFNAAQNWIVANLGWFYMLVIGLFVAFAIVVAASRYGRIRLGRDDEKPEFSMTSWFAMLFAAGMGIGLVFYGVSEPLGYATIDPKPGWEGGQAELSGLAMAQTFVHWGLHPWAIYAVIGLALAYAIHRRGRPVSIRWALEPLFGERVVKGWIGDVIDVIAIVGTVFGVATSLGLGVQQIASGLNEIGVIGEANNVVLIVLIVIITFLATFSVVSGLGAGIRWLSNINLSLAGLLLISVLLLGPTLFLLQNFVESIGIYLANMLQMTFDVGAYQRTEEAATWFSSWTIFYWGWWIAWAPFVGVFIARISRGRTIREFITGVLVVPTLVGFFWFAVMGGAGLFQQFYGSGGLDAVLNREDGTGYSRVLFSVLGELPLGSVLSVLAIVVIAIFFITSSDSGSLVVDMLASGGHPNPPTWSRVLWALLEGGLAITLLLAGGLQPLQAGSLITALPFSVILVLMCVATLRALRRDHLVLQHRREQEQVEALTEQVSSGLPANQALGSYVDDRIDYRLSRTTGRSRMTADPRSGSVREPVRGDDPR